MDKKPLSDFAKKYNKAYQPEYCQMLIDHMAKGFSFESFAGVIQVARSTIFEWVKAGGNYYQEDFAISKAIGESNSLHFWEELGIDGTKGKIPNFNGKTWDINIKNRFRELWQADKQTIELQSGGINLNLYMPDNKRNDNNA